MGYFSNNRSVSDSSKAENAEEATFRKSKIEIRIYVDFFEDDGGLSTITFTEDATGIKHRFKSVNRSSDVDETSFLAYSAVDDAILKTTTNLRDCLLRDSYFKTNFDIEIIPSDKTNFAYPFDPYILRMTSKQIGRQFDCSVETQLINNYITYDIDIQKSGDNRPYSIVKVDAPQEITLANNPNFVTFRNNNDEQKTQPALMTIAISSSGASEWESSLVKITITEHQSQQPHTFLGVYNTKDLTENSFIINTSNRGEIATLFNLRECMMRNSFISNNYELNIPLFQNDDNLLEAQNTLVLTSKGYGTQYNCDISVSYNNIEQETIEIEDIVLDIDPAYISVTEDDDTSLYVSYRNGSLAALDVNYFIGKLALSADSPDYEYLIVKPDNVQYTEEEARIKTLENLKTAMLSNDVINDMFEIKLNASKGLLLTYKISSNYVLQDIQIPKAIFSNVQIPDITIRPAYPYQFRYVFKTSSQKSLGTDSIDNGLGNYSIELDVYTDNDIKWGKQIDSSQWAGKYLTTLSKSYFGRPLWFELNTLMSKKVSYSPLFLTAFDKPETSWIDAGTIANYRFVARRTGQNSTEPVYMSDILYTINGYDYTLNDSHLGYGQTDVDNYILDLSKSFESKDFVKVKPLTTNRERTHIKGQKQYYNCILKSKPFETAESVEIAILYKLYTQSGKAIANVVEAWTNADSMQTINTSLLKLDQFLPGYEGKTVGRIDVCLIAPSDADPTKTYIELSENISYRILPSALHTVNDFAFLNRLGGWDSMNFGGSTSNEFKVTSSSIFKTLQPGFTQYSEIESVSSKSVEETRTVQSSPLTRNVVEWLREFSASPAIYELSTRRYVLIDDMSLKYNSVDDLFQIDLKYHYSDVFNGRMK